MDAERIIGVIVFVAVVAAFFYDRIFGWRALGVAEVAYGIWAIRVRRIPYGWEGQPPAGYFTGGAAVFVGLLAVALGLLFVIFPRVIDDALSNT